ncbi:MAG TPA: ATP-binding protein [Sedimentisphaerales bacterium]|nr:ATP-binding protein [Sedimentisphaerales bacterium]
MVSKTPAGRSIVITSVPSAIEGICQRILPELKAHNYSEEDVFAVHLALQEAFLNALTHGNRMDAKKAIKIDYSVAPDKIEVSMTDEGDGFDPQSVPDPRCSENLFKTEGRGLLLIRSYMDVVKFNGRGNGVHMIRYKERRNRR